MFRGFILLLVIQLYYPLLGATIAIGSSVSSSIIDTNIDGPNSGVSTMNFSRTDVDGDNSDWAVSDVTSLGIQTLEASTSSGSIAVARGSGSGRSVTGSEFSSEIDFELGAGETGTYAFSFDYTLTESSASASDPSVSWSLLDSNGNVIAGSSDNTASGSVETLNGSGTIGEGSYTLVVSGSVSGTPARNSSASAVLNSANLTVDVTVPVVPEPSTSLLLGLGALMMWKRRRG